MKSGLRRLDDCYYEGFNAVHWIHSIDERKTGWLTPEFHIRFRECCTHACFKFQVLCSVYTLMPDHIHMLCLGYSENSEQKKAMYFLRRHLNSELEPYQLQKQGYDHVLREHERENEALMAIATYILENPVRKDIVKSPQEYPYSGCILPGYPEVNHTAPDYWERFWKIYAYISTT